MKDKVLKVLLIIALLITLTISDFILLGAEFVTYAQDNAGNVRFEVYFKNGMEKVSKMDYSMNYSDMRLHIKVSVESGIKFDGIITLADSNFKLNNILASEKARIKDNVIILNPITGGNTVEIEVGIEPIITENYDISLLSKESKLTLSGSYITKDNKNVLVDISKNVTLNLLTPQNLKDLTKLETKVITNSVYKIDEIPTRIVQVELNSGIAGNVYPIKTTTFEIALPERAEVEEVISKGTYTTNGQADRKIEEYYLENNILRVEIANVETNGEIPSQGHCNQRCAGVRGAGD